MPSGFFLYRWELKESYCMNNTIREALFDMTKWYYDLFGTFDNECIINVYSHTLNQ